MILLSHIFVIVFKEVLLTVFFYPKISLLIYKVDTQFQY